MISLACVFLHCFYNITILHEIENLDFTEIMRTLGYPRLISIENFRTPNFELVADVMFWMIRRYHPNIPVHEGIESENDRIKFLTDITQIIFHGANITLDTKRLYAADGYAVKELLKVANLLYTAQKMHESNTSNELESKVKEVMPHQKWLQKAKDARKLSSEITEVGASLHDLLSKEQDLRETRTASLIFFDSLVNSVDNGLDNDHIENSLSRILGKIKYDSDQFSKQQINLESDGKGLEEKIKSKKVDFESNQKRLSSLENMRPAFMDEYEKLELDLKHYYSIYVDLFRNVHYLENELCMLKESENEKRDEAYREMKLIQKNLKQEELNIIKVEEDLSVEIEDINDPAVKLSLSVTIDACERSESSECTQNSSSGSFDSNIESTIPFATRDASTVETESTSGSIQSGEELSISKTCSSSGTSELEDVSISFDRDSNGSFDSHDEKSPESDSDGDF